MTLAQRIAMHALFVWALVLSLAVLSSDLAWQYKARWHRRAAAEGRHSDVMRWRATLLLILAMALLFAFLAFAVTARKTGALVPFDTALADSLHANLSVTIWHVVVWITQLGSSAFIVPVAGVVALILIWRRYWQRAAGSGQRAAA
ncbi:MAG: hypothetical protein ABI767_12990 [Rhodanobacter sp.]